MASAEFVFLPVPVVNKWDIEKRITSYMKMKFCLVTGFRIWSFHGAPRNITGRFFIPLRINDKLSGVFYCSKETFVAMNTSSVKGTISKGKDRLPIIHLFESLIVSEGKSYISSCCVFFNNWWAPPIFSDAISRIPTPKHSKTGTFLVSEYN